MITREEVTAKKNPNECGEVAKKSGVQRMKTCPILGQSWQTDPLVLISQLPSEKLRLPSVLSIRTPSCIRTS